MLFIIFCSVFMSYAQTRQQNGIITKVVLNYNDTSVMNFIDNSALYTEGWDSLAHTQLWRQVICMSSDSCILNIASERKSLMKVGNTEWMSRSEQEKVIFKDSIRDMYCLNPGTDLYVTKGKEEFFEQRKVLPEISKAISVFKANNCDPWYAQSILLIESPGRAKAKSYVGANGPFQLMKSVARKYGLKVAKGIDERTNLEKSARAASSLLKTACIPYIKSYLDGYNIHYNESDLWFRLLVLHAYHAGAGNVKCVLGVINPAEGGIKLFQKIWTTTCGGFKNESQNYSQIALASLLRFDEILNQDNDTVFLVQGDKYLSRYSRNKNHVDQSASFLNQCILHYENDLVDGTIPYDYFMKRIGSIRKELMAIYNAKPGKQKVVIGTYPADDTHINNLASRLLRKRRFDDAISLLKINIEMHPRSVSAYENIANAYTQSGKLKQASIYSSKSMAMGRGVEIKNE